ncbi:MAG: AN1-type zinc finger domain-containing protein [Candidatus Bathyarchaeia archaeon]
MKCQYCGKNVDLPFRCSFCGMYHCEEHRLPENHHCPELWKAALIKPSEKEKISGLREERPFESLSQPTFQYPFKIKREGWISTTELAHLTIGALIVMAVGLAWDSVGLEWVFKIFSDPISTFISAAIFTFIFLSHELAHKAVAKQYGLWAEFRINPIGAAFTVMTIAVPLIKIISPGAVVIAGAANKKVIGVSALAGPLTSIGLTGVFLFFAFLFHGSLNTLLLNSAALSIWIAVLNLVPFGIFDGAKVFWWNKAVWATSFTVAVVLMLFTLLI